MNSLDLALSFKSLSDDGAVEGLAAGYGNVDLGGDRIMPGAASKSLAQRSTLPMLFCHDLTRPIGVWSELKETGDGLQVKGRIVTATQAGAEAYALAKAGALTGISIGYDLKQHRMAGDVRELHEIGLHEASLVPVPMNERAKVTGLKTVGSKRDLEDLLRDAGLPKAAALKLAAGGWPALSNEPDETPEIERFLARIKAATADLKG